MALISTTGPICPNVTDTPLDNRSRVSTIAGIGNIPLAWKGMLVYCEENGKTYKVTSLKSKTSGPVVIENYYPATWVEFGSGGGTPSPTPSAVDAGDVTYSSSGTFRDGTVGKELQSLASDIGSKVSGIQVTGEDSIRYPVNGIVTIPAGGGGTGTITGATVGGNPVTASGGILQFDAYPTVPITSIETSDHTPLAPNNGLVTLPPIPVDQSSRIKKIEDSIAQMGNNQPIVIPPSAVELPVSTSNPDYIDYDSDTAYVMNIDGTQVATIHYPYIDNSNNYVAFKAIDRDLYYAYIVSVVNDAERYTYSNQYTWSTLPADAKSKFESGIYAIKQVINDDGTLPEKKWYKNIPSVFVDKNNLPLRTRRINETISSSVIDVLLVKNDRLNKIYRYAFNGISNTWVLINGGCYTKDDATTGANYNKYDKFFDRPNASNVDYDNTNSGLSATNVKAAIDETFTTLKHTSGSATVSSASFTLPSTVTGNTYYDITSTPITSLTIPSIDSSYEVVIKFTTDSTNPCTIAIPNNQKYIGDLSVDKGVTCIISIFNGVIVIAETETNSQTE